MQRWWAMALALCACGGDPSDEDVAKEANSKVEACADPNEWPTPTGSGIPNCVSPCVRRPPLNTAALPDRYIVCCFNGQTSCQTDRWILVDGVPGVCLLGLEAVGGGPQFADRIMWQHCNERR